MGRLKINWACGAGPRPAADALVGLPVEAGRGRPPHKHGAFFGGQEQHNNKTITATAPDGSGVFDGGWLLS
jgi:hypothetical protein